MAAERDSRLLQGQDLESALAWAAHKSLSHLDYRFLAASQELKKLKTERKANQILAEVKQKAELALEKERQANQRLVEAQRKAKQQICTGSTILVMSLVGSIAAVGLALRQPLETYPPLALINFNRGDRLL